MPSTNHPRFLINISPYSDRNSSYKAILDSALNAMRSEKDPLNAHFAACDVCKPIWSDGIAFLDQSELKGLPEYEGAHRMFGVYKGQQEPSLAIEIQVSFEKLAIVRKAVCAFGKYFEQECVHITQSAGGTLLIPSLENGSRYQFCWLVWFEELQLLPHIAELVAGFGIQSFSLKGGGNQLLVYQTENVERTPPTMPTEVASLRQHLIESGKAFMERQWHLRLESYGNEDYNTRIQQGTV